jgi:hypothetical protein
MKYVALFLAGFVCGIGVLLLFPSLYSSIRKTDSDLQGTHLKEGVVVEESSDEATFTHPKLGFSITYPRELQVSEYDEGEGARTILFQKKEEQYGFQMFIIPYAEDSISADRIKKDIPSGIVDEPQEVVIGDGILATVFWSESTLIGRTREAWFTHEGYLYEVTGYASQDALLAQVLGTLTFVNKK